MSMNQPDIEQIQRAVATSLHEALGALSGRGDHSHHPRSGRRRYSADRHARGRNSVWLALSHVSAGIAKPIPTLPPEGEKIAVLTPTTWPWVLKVGPPELPRLTGASICRKSGPGANVAPTRRNDARGHRPTQSEGIAYRDHPVAHP
jgi:hypothetical protein